MQASKPLGHKISTFTHQIPSAFSSQLICEALKFTILADRGFEPTTFNFKCNHHTTRPHYSSIRYGNLSRQICDNVRSVRLWSLPIWQTGEWNLHPSSLNAISTPLDPNHSPIPSGNLSRQFCDSVRSVRLWSPPISSGRLSRLFSDTSRHVRLPRLPISCKVRKMTNFKMQCFLCIMWWISKTKITTLWFIQTHMIITCSFC